MDILFTRLALSVYRDFQFLRYQGNYISASFALNIFEFFNCFRAEIHQALLSQSSLLVEFLNGIVPVQDLDSRDLTLVNLAPVYFLEFIILCDELVIPV